MRDSGKNLLVMPLRRLSDAWHTVLARCDQRVDCGSLIELLTIAVRFESDFSISGAEVLKLQGEKMELGTLVGVVRRRCLESADAILHECVLLLEEAELTPRPAEGALARFLEERKGYYMLKQRKKFRQPQAARTFILIQLTSYLKCVEQAPKLFGEYVQNSLGLGNVWRSGLQEAVQESAAMGRELRLAIEKLKVVRQRRWEMQLSVESAALDKLAAFVRGRETKKMRGIGTLVWAVVFAAPGYLLVTMPTPSMVVGLVGGVSVVISIVLAYKSLTKLATEPE